MSEQERENGAERGRTLVSNVPGIVYRMLEWERKSENSTIAAGWGIKRVL